MLPYRQCRVHHNVFVNSSVCPQSIPSLQENGNLHQLDPPQRGRRDGTAIGRGCHRYCSLQNTQCTLQRWTIVWNPPAPSLHVIDESTRVGRSVGISISPTTGAEAGGKTTTSNNKEQQACAMLHDAARFFCVRKSLNHCPDGVQQRASKPSCA